MPLLLAVMTRILPSVLAETIGYEGSPSKSASQVIRKADRLLVAQVPELKQISDDRRKRYWRALLQAMTEDQIISRSFYQVKSRITT